MTNEKRYNEVKKASCCDYSVDSILSVDDRGQIVLPKEIRESAGIKSGDKLALISWKKEDKICCVVLLPAENLTDLINQLMGSLNMKNR